MTVKYSKLEYGIYLWFKFSINLSQNNTFFLNIKIGEILSIIMKVQ